MNTSKYISAMLMTVLVFGCLAAIASASDPYDDEFWDNYGDYQDQAAGFALLGLGLVCIIPIIWLIIAIVIAIWVYKDAEKRGKSGALWLIIVILTGIIGLIIWFVIRPPIGGEPAAAAATGGAGERRCPNCGRGIPNDAQVCPYCGKNFTQ